MGISLHILELKATYVFGPFYKRVCASYNSISGDNRKVKFKTTVSNRVPLECPIQIMLPLKSPKRNGYLPHETTIIEPIKPKNHTRKRAISTTSDILSLMDSLKLTIPLDMYVTLIKECTESRDFRRALELHSHLNKSGLRPGLSLLNRLLIMYVSCSRVDYAHQLFNLIPGKNFNSWAIMIVGYAETSHYTEAIHMFLEMQHKSIVLEFPAWILVCFMKACVQTLDLELGKQMHGLLLKTGFAENMFLSSSLINFYGKLGCLEDSKFIFDQLSRRDIVAWTSIIVNNCNKEHFYDALDAFKEMGKVGMRKNNFTFSSILRACSWIGDDGQCGQQIHSHTIKLGVELDPFVQCGLVDMYGKCGLFREARRVFEGRKGNSACWNAMLSGYIQNGLCHEAIKFLYQMKAAGMQPQESMLSDVRVICGSEDVEGGTQGMYM